MTLYWTLPERFTVISELPKLVSYFPLHYFYLLYLGFPGTWRIPWTEEPGGPHYIGFQRVRRDWSNLALTTLLYLNFCLVWQQLEVAFNYYSCSEPMANKSKSPMEFFAKYLFEPLTFLCITNTTDIFQPPLLFVADSFPPHPPAPNQFKHHFLRSLWFLILCVTLVP